MVLGLDVPIGLPADYARRAGVDDFIGLLPRLGRGRWGDFYTVRSTPDDISLTRPFYPMRPGGTRQRHLLDGLGVQDMSDLLRRCDAATADRGAASPLFWTLGGKQVGKAAIIAWRDLIAPGLMDDELSVSIWPFDGSLQALVSGGGIVIAETYPAEACLHLGLRPPGRGWSKRTREGRLAQKDRIERWAERRLVTFDGALHHRLADGFGPSTHADDPFDAMLGLLSMIEVATGHRPPGAPGTREVRTVEGWILGQAAHDHR